MTLNLSLALLSKTYVFFMPYGPQNAKCGSSPNPFWKSPLPHLQTATCSKPCEYLKAYTMPPQTVKKVPTCNENWQCRNNWFTFSALPKHWGQAFASIIYRKKNYPHLPTTKYLSSLRVSNLPINTYNLNWHFIHSLYPIFGYKLKGLCCLLCSIFTLFSSSLKC